jgi:hypothetical protein
MRRGGPLWTEGTCGGERHPLQNSDAVFPHHGTVSCRSFSAPKKLATSIEFAKRAFGPWLIQLHEIPLSFPCCFHVVSLSVCMANEVVIYYQAWGWMQTVSGFEAQDTTLSYKPDKNSTTP